MVAPEWGLCSKDHIAISGPGPIVFFLLLYSVQEEKGHE